MTQRRYAPPGGRILRNGWPDWPECPTGHDAGSDWRDVASGKSDHPVVLANWHDTEAYCEWAGRRLPTEAEWEKAARGTDGRVYPWGNERPTREHCNFYHDVGATTPVGKYSPQGDSPYGAADMAGNVFEWVADWYDKDYYAVSPKDNPQGPAAGEYRVVRGGSWIANDDGVRAAGRHDRTPDGRNVRYGFRCARSPSS